MRWLAMYLRQVFCAHDWCSEENKVSYYSGLLSRDVSGIRVCVTCSKCAYHKSYWKFGRA